MKKFKNLLIRAANGQLVRLGELVEIKTIISPSTINREWARRRIVIQANVRKRDLGSFVEEAKRMIKQKVSLKQGYYVKYSGQFEHLERARNRLMIVVPLALFLIFTLLFISFGRIREVLLISTGVPFSAVGGVVALWLRDMPFSISVGVGFVAVSGVAVLGQLVLVNAIRDRLSDGMDFKESVREMAVARMRPVLMTGLVAALGFIPMALNTGIGAEVQRPLATVVIGGVVTSMLATLLILPLLYIIVGPGSDDQSKPAPDVQPAEELQEVTP